jgi:hypothetical protein
MQKVYWRCNSGHYYSVRNCPLDGWSRPELHRLWDVVNDMNKSMEQVSIAALKLHGFDKEVLDRVIIIEFSGDSAPFDGFDPKGYIIKGRYMPLSELGTEYK